MIGTIDRAIQMPFGTLGRFTAENFACWMLEPPWRDNELFRSCVPEGVYEVAPDGEGRYTGYPELQAVPGRTEIIIHPGTFVTDLEGCLAPAFGYLLTTDGVRLDGTSREAYQALVDTMGDLWTLVIRSRRSRL